MSETLASQHSLDTHTIYNLQIALAKEKKRRIRGKRLTLLGEEHSAGTEFWSPNKVQRARDYNDTKEAYKAQKFQDIAERKARVSVSPCCCCYRGSGGVSDALILTFSALLSFASPTHLLHLHSCVHAGSCSSYSI